MRTLMRSILVTGVLAIGATALPAAPASDFDQWYQKKFGRSTPMEEARLKAEAADTAFRAETPGMPAVPNWIEQHLNGKLGRNSPAEDARLEAERDNTAFREENPSDLGPAVPNWIEQHFRGKLGRNPGR